jgi:hypothetical protein
MTHAHFGALPAAILCGNAQFSRVGWDLLRVSRSASVSHLHGIAKALVELQPTTRGRAPIRHPASSAEHADDAIHGIV